MKVSDLMRNYRPGSQDWSWKEEFEEIDDRLFNEPIMLGTDGRVLNGHHRIRLAAALDYDGELPVEMLGMAGIEQSLEDAKEGRIVKRPLDKP